MVSYRFDDFIFDADAFELRHASKRVALQPKVLDVLRYLIEHRGRMVARTELLDHLWRGEDVNEAVINWSVSHLRRALGQRRNDRHPIETVHGRGYRFTAEVMALAGTHSEPPPCEPGVAALVGRERAMSELQQCVEEATQGRGKLCVITGESGIGKTRCAEELGRWAASLNVLMLAGRCPQAPGAPPLWPIDAALRELGGELAARMHRLVANTGTDNDVHLPASGARARFQTIESAAGLLREIAAARPTLLILDDIHWADAGTLQLLGFIAPELAELPLCIVATLRDGERVPGGPRDRELLHVLRHARTFPLGSLNSEQVADLIAAISGRRPIVELAEAVRRASGGIPLFIQQVVRSLLREHGEDGLEGLRPDAVRVPALARDLLRERIHQLPASTIEILSCAAVIGDTFELSPLAGLLDLEPEELLDRLAPAIVEGQLESDAPHAYRFAHSLFQSVLYDDMLPGQRVTIHRKIGQLLGQRTDSTSRKGEIARHYYYSLAAGDHEAVMRRARDAGVAAAAVFAFDDAVLYFSWALEAQVAAGAAEARPRAELLRSLAAAQRSAGRTGDATDTAARVIELAQQHRMHDLVVAATRLRRPTVALASVPDSLSRSALELVLRQLPATSDPVRISALSQLACVPPYERDLASSKELSACAVALAEQQDDREVLFEALRARLFSLSGPDDVNDLLQVADRMLALEHAGPRSWQSMDARVARFATFVLQGRIADADAALGEMDAALRGPWGEAMFFCQRTRAQRRFLDGHFAEAEERWKSVFAQAVRAGVSYAELLRDAQALNLELEREGPAWVVERRVRAISSGQRLPRSFRAGMARIAAEAGALEIVRAQLATLGDPGDCPRDGAYLHTLASLSVCAAAIGDKARCEQLHELLSPYSELNTPDAMGYYLGSVSYFLGRLCVALGKTVQARGRFERALEHNRAMGYRAGVVRTLMSLAELEQRMGQAARARASFEAARREALALGMRSAAADAESALAGGAGRRTKRS